MTYALPFAALILAAAAAPAPDPLQARLVAEAGQIPPAALAFDRTVTTTQSGGGKAETSVRVERWDGRQLTLVTTDGKPPTVDETAQFSKQAAGRPVAGYYRLAHYLGAPAERASDAAGGIVFRIARLPAGSIDISGDRSDRFAGEATVATAGPLSYVRRLHLHAREPFRVMIVARIDRFDVVSDYAPGKSGRPELTRQVQEYAGSRPGESGTVRTESVYSYR